MRAATARAKQSAKKALQHVRLQYLAQQDIARFSRHAALSTFDRDLPRVTSRIMYNVHALEKGLARNHDLRPGFGRKALTHLNDAMLLYRASGYDLAAFPYQEGLGVLRRYADLHERLGHDVDFLPAVVDPTHFSAENAGSTTAGTIEVRRDQKQRNTSKNFAELALGRTSIREFSGDAIDQTKVEDAIRVALKSPSVCNRQGWRVHWLSDKTTMKEVLAHQRGFGYREMPEVLMCVTVSNSTFISPVERNQGFVDGGLFAMSILYGLEYQGLAAVPLNACLYSGAQKAIRSIVPIPEAEVIVMFIAVGDFPESSQAPASSRKPLESVVVRH
ncbi:nitroreductase family protein [uncultured Serinicoccus sp.]|uniref:nitroreductase family protein n=1 Tax=uncultured Serinicoccus sp. TaxID=735514 RepID=UPI0026346996|nr:nitroreductase family protein [uncultured Serinicoccus sp.]